MQCDAMQYTMQGFIPLFLLATAVHKSTGTALFNSYVVLLIMALFAFTNGYNGSLCMMFAPVRWPIAAC